MIRLIRTDRGGMLKAVRRILLLPGLLLCGALSVYPQAPSAGEVQAGNPQHLSPGEAVDMAIRNNLSLETARIGLDIKKRKSNLVWNEFLPTLGVNGILSRTNWASSQSVTSAIPGTGTPVTLQGRSGLLNPTTFSTEVSLPQWSLNGMFTASLYFSFALIEGIQSFKEDYQAGLISYEKAKLQMEQGVRKMYNQILLQEASAALLLENYNNARRQADIAEANFRAGLAPRLTWLQAQVAVENMKPTMNDMDNGLKSLKGNFALLLGLSYDTPFELESISFGVSYIPDDVANLISRAASGKPDIQELQANIMTLQTQRKAQRLQAYTPFLNFGWTVSSSFSEDPWKDNWFNRENWRAGGSFSITLGMNFNGLFPFTKEGQQRKDMDAGLQIQNIRLAQTIQETELEVFTKVNSLEKIRTTKDAQQAAVDLAEESYKLTEEAYRAGLQDFQAVRSAGLALEQAKLQLLTQQFNYLNDLIDLEYSIGVPFGTLSSSGNIVSERTPSNKGSVK